MIFAAGFGTRMRPLTDKMPKPMVPVAGRPMIDHAIDLAREAGARRLVANLHYLPASLDAHLKARQVETILETPDILDTGGGLLNALPLFGDGPVWTANPDVAWRGPNPLTFALEHWNPVEMDALLVCLEPERILGPSQRGDFSMDGARALSRGGHLVYGGVQILKTDGLADDGIGAFSLNRTWDRMIAARRCFGALYPGQWCDIGHPAGIPLAETLLAKAHHD